MNTEKILIIIMLSAVITFLLRALPFLIFKGKKELPKNIVYLGKILPSSIMAVLIVYCLKDIGNNFLGDGLFKIIAVLVVGISYKIKHNTLISIVSGTICYMLLLKI